MGRYRGTNSVPCPRHFYSPSEPLVPWVRDTQLLKHARTDLSFRAPSVIDRATDLTIPILARSFCHVNSDEDFAICGAVLGELVHPDGPGLKAYRSSHPSPPPMINRIMKGIQEWPSILFDAIAFQVEWLNFERCAHAIKTFQWICQDAAALKPKPHVAFFKSLFMSKSFWKAVVSVLVKKRKVIPQKPTKAKAVEAGVGVVRRENVAEEESEEKQTEDRADGDRSKEGGAELTEEETAEAESGPLKKCDVPSLAVLELLGDILKLCVEEFPSNTENFVRLLLNAGLFDRLDESIATTAFQPGVPCKFSSIFSASLY